MKALSRLAEGLSLLLAASLLIGGDCDPDGPKLTHVFGETPAKGIKSIKIFLWDDGTTTTKGKASDGTPTKMRVDTGPWSDFEEAGDGVSTTFTPTSKIWYLEYWAQGTGTQKKKVGKGKFKKIT